MVSDLWTSLYIYIYISKGFFLSWSSLAPWQQSSYWSKTSSFLVVLLQNYIPSCSLKKINLFKCFDLLVLLYLCFFSAVGSWNNSPLSQDPVPVGRHSDRSARRPLHSGEASQEQTEADHPRDGRKARPRPQGGQIRRVLSPNAGKSSPFRQHLPAVVGGSTFASFANSISLKTTSI